MKATRESTIVLVGIMFTQFEHIAVDDLKAPVKNLPTHFLVRGNLKHVK